MNKRISLPVAMTLLLAVSACSHLPSWMGGSTEAKPRLPGERVDVLPPDAGLTPDPVMASLAVNLPPPQGNAEWGQHTGLFTAETANLAGGEFKDEESAEIGDGESFEHVLLPRPVVAGGSVFAMDAAGYISAHDMNNIGKVRWESKGLSEEDDPDLLGGGLAYDQGTLYATSGRGGVGAFDAATGKPIWLKNLHVPLRSAPRVALGRIFVITIDSQTFALNAATGDVLWSQRGIAETAGIMNSVSPVVANDMVIVPYSSGELYALGAVDGREVWNTSLSQTDRTQATSAMFSGIGGDPVVDGRVLFAVSSGGMLTVFDLIQGGKLWDRPIPSVNTPWVAGDYLFLLTEDNTLVAFVKYSGQVRWSMKLRSFEDEKRRLRPITWKGPVLTNGRLAVVNSIGRLLLVSAADGKITSEIDVPDDIYTAPVIAGGRMFLVGKNAKLYSLK